MQKKLFYLLWAAGLLVFRLSAQPAAPQLFSAEDLFDLEYISDPQISPDGERIVYVRNFMDIHTDQTLSNLWIIDFDGSRNRPLTTGNQHDYAPRWSPDGRRLLYLSDKGGSVQLYQRWLDEGAEAKLTNLTRTPRNPKWSPDGRRIAFQLSVEASASSEKIARQLPQPPKGAEWAPEPVVIDKLNYRSDGNFGFLPDRYTHLFVLSAEGGHPRQLTTGDFNHGDFCWSADSEALIFSGNRREEAEYQPRNTEIYRVSVADGRVVALTDREGPDQAPRLSPDGRLIAYTGFDDRYQGYQVSRLYVMNADGSNPRLISKDLDRSVANIQWADDSRGLFFQYDDQGNTKVAYIDLSGAVMDLTGDVGGLSVGRPYDGGDFSVSETGRYAFTHSTPDHPADLAVGRMGSGEIKRLTRVNDDLFGYKTLGEVEEIWYESSYDGRRIQGWICKPPDFDPNRKYPLLLEIHGGPFANYGDRFAAELQLYAAAGYVVLYTNPRGSSSYGEEFGNLIHHNYPSQDYDDLMSGVDAVIAEGYVDPDQLYVTGGSGGGVLTAWIVGKTDRFRAAVVAKPVINWTSFVLHADGPAFFSRYWFPGYPWEEFEQYWQRSPLSLVGNVVTPTMLLTGEQDYRTPMSETEQYYAALKLRKVETAMVRIQEAGHGIARKPSNLIRKVAYVLGWFEKYR